jgi:hypothetical protein
MDNRPIPNSAEESKRLAYLLDLKTIALEDLVFGYSLGQALIDLSRSLNNLSDCNDLFYCND